MNIVEYDLLCTYLTQILTIMRYKHSNFQMVSLDSACIEHRDTFGIRFKHTHKEQFLYLYIDISHTIAYNITALEAHLPAVGE